MKKTFLIVILIHIANLTFAQDTISTNVYKKYGFIERTIVAKNDTIFFYTHSTGNKPKNKLVVFISGSTPDPIFTYEVENGKIKSYLWGHNDYKYLNEDYVYVLIAKKGMNGVFDEKNLDTRKPPQSYLEKNSLDYRVWQSDKVINYCFKKLLTKPTKIIVYGHSEGFNVVSKLVTVNKKITHAGLWAGSAMPDYYDFIMFRRKDYLKGQIKDSLSAYKIDTLLNDYKQIFERPNDIKSNSIYTNKRWSSYAEPSINHLLKTKIPLYMVVSTKDENAPIESAYIVPLEFIRNKKTNLTFKTCVSCDHSFNLNNADNTKTKYWDYYFKDFIEWANLK